MSKNNVRRGFIISSAMDEKLKEIQEYLAMKTMTGALEHCINYTYQKELNNYVNVQRNRTPRVAMSAEERVELSTKKYQEKRDVEAKIKYDKCLEIAKMLDARIDTDASGNEIARWDTYSKVNDNYVAEGQIGCSVSELHEGYLETQFINGTKEEIFKILNK